jgi:hypothetical protein
MIRPIAPRRSMALVDCRCADRDVMRRVVSGGCGDDFHAVTYTVCCSSNCITIKNMKREEEKKEQDDNRQDRGWK